jgi:hypothetical protein
MYADIYVGLFECSPAMQWLLGHSVHRLPNEVDPVSHFDLVNEATKNVLLHALCVLSVLHRPGLRPASAAEFRTEGAKVTPESSLKRNDMLGHSRTFPFPSHFYCFSGRIVIPFDH